MRRTPDDEWSVEVLRARAGNCFRVRRRAIIGGRGWAPIGQLGFTVDEVSELLVPRFADLVGVAA